MHTTSSIKNEGRRNVRGTCQPASMLLRSEPSKEPERTQIWDRLNSLTTSIDGSHTFIVALAPYTSCDAPVYAIACCTHPYHTYCPVTTYHTPPLQYFIIIYLLKFKIQFLYSSMNIGLDGVIHNLILGPGVVLFPAEFVFPFYVE